MTPALHAALQQFAQREKLPSSYLDTVEHWFLPLAEEILQRAKSSKLAPLVGVSGCQGSGKTTLAALLVLLLRELGGLDCVNLSIDDFYLTHAQRQQLSRTVHPLLATRGVPGTHDVQLALDTIAALRKPGTVAIPRFDKAIDDRMPAAQWPRVDAPVDVIVIEGWCLSIGPQTHAQLEEAINSLEEQEDSEGAWRRYVNERIGGEYAQLYDSVDFLVMLKAPDFAKVFEWRQNQEDKLLAKSAMQNLQDGDQPMRIMNREQLRRFIQHYERITRHGLDTLPLKADVVFQLTGEQTIAGKLKG
jgi:D-glycerate 3-kinase